MLTRLTRGTVGRILKACARTSAPCSPRMFLLGAAELIRREKIALAIETLRYDKTAETYDVTIFDTDRREVSLGSVLILYSLALKKPGG